MSGIGCELISHGGYSVLPDHSFSMKILWNSIGIPSSKGKDVYHESGLILSNKRIAATGRIHHLSKDTTNWFEPLQTKPATLIDTPKEKLNDLKVEVIVPPINSAKPIDRIAFLYFLQEEKQKFTRHPIYIDPQAVEKVDPVTFHIDISTYIPNLFKT